MSKSDTQGKVKAVSLGELNSFAANTSKEVWDFPDLTEEEVKVLSGFNEEDDKEEEIESIKNTIVSSLEAGDVAVFAQAIRKGLKMVEGVEELSKILLSDFNAKHNSNFISLSQLSYEYIKQNYQSGNLEAAMKFSAISGLSRQVIFAVSRDLEPENIDNRIRILESYRDEIILAGQEGRDELVQAKISELEKRKNPTELFEIPSDSHFVAELGADREDEEDDLLISPLKRPKIVHAKKFQDQQGREI